MGDNMLIKAVNGHMFPAAMLETRSHLGMQPVRSSAITSPLGTLGPYKTRRSAWSAQGWALNWG